MKKFVIAALSAVTSLVCAFGVSFTHTLADDETNVPIEKLGISAVAGWDLSNRDYACFDVNLSRDALMMNETMDNIGYRIIDGAVTVNGTPVYPASENLTYLQDYIEFNGETMRKINVETDVSDYDFIVYPSSTGVPYNVPIIINCVSKSQMQIRVHRDWLDEKGLSAGGLKITFKKGFYVNAKKTNEEMTGYDAVKYEFDSNVSLTRNRDDWTCDTPFEGYVPNEEVVIRKDIDFTKINYDAITISSLSQFIPYGDFKQINGKSVQNMLFQVYFDKPVFYQTVDYASVSKSNMKKFCMNTMTEAQIDAWFDYRLDLSFADYLLINGKTLKEIKRASTSDMEFKVFTQYSGNPYALTVYIEANEEFYLDSSENCTFTLKKGFRTPLFGEIKEDEIFYYNPETQTWNPSAPDTSVPNYGTEHEEIVGYVTSGGGCSSSASGTIVLLPLTAVATYIICRRKKNDE